MKVVNLSDFYPEAIESDAKIIVIWWSGGATSAVATKMVIDSKRPEDTIRIVTTETGSHHEDHQRFLSDCEQWYGQKIEVIRHHRFMSHYDVVQKTKFINSPRGAKCTAELKRGVRERWERTNFYDVAVWGMEFSPNEERRAMRINATQPHVAHRFPLIDAMITKVNCLRILQNVGIALPAMYLLGYNNANCVGCVKGGMAYWNKIRMDFPEVFDRMARIEREIGHSCLRRNGKPLYLDDLEPDAGRGTAPLVGDCGAVGEGCEIEINRKRLDE